MQYLEDNEKLITTALEYLSQGKSQEAAKLQTLLQRNLMWLASIADAQSQPPQPAPAEAQVGTHPAGMQRASSPFHCIRPGENRVTSCAILAEMYGPFLLLILAIRKGAWPQHSTGPHSRTLVGGGAAFTRSLRSRPSSVILEVHQQCDLG